ncbi:outer membrane beta-barrel protein [Aurantimonas sp. C2-6-R+9]|uniref:outer membrane protein n=1 Tax=unclassified Aurantimonas TaxID=2638230 RepID=UPI002E1987BE|nr:MULTISPECIES: outer membrane beta-barrel protein [unclassified Aurantimonas]MEC5290917.1 outer membrane beta-barrel protein [Aurantimonas sp. C2-3-R2]MEC5381094.1 outer membrane beta-barrel protein [Aurantimonas sp. C2-6-R+9]MEC5412067.1 outer membrane beta-barrel protein [Aurantimonas sp. C2-4-R8]
MGVKLFAALTTVTLIASGANAADVVTVTDTTPVFEPASTYSFYLGLKGGAGPIIGDNDFTSAPTPFRVERIDGSIDYDTGYAIAVEAGIYLTPNWRAGVELAYARMEPETLNQGVFAPFRDSLNGDIEAYNVFAETAYEFGPFGVFRPYVKAGVGAVHISLDNVTSSTTFNGVADDSDTVFAGRIGAGAAIALSERFDLIAEYDFTYGQDAEFEFTFPTFPGTGTAPFEVEVAAHRVLAGIRARF